MRGGPGSVNKVEILSFPLFFSISSFPSWLHHHHHHHLHHFHFHLHRLLILKLSSKLICIKQIAQNSSKLCNFTILQFHDFMRFWCDLTTILHVFRFCYRFGFFFFFFFFMILMTILTTMVSATMIKAKLASMDFDTTVI